MIGLGIVTYNRPGRFAELVESVREHIGAKVDHLVVYNDGSGAFHDDGYMRAYDRLDANQVQHAPKNRGVAAAKNWCLRRLLEAGCEWIFIAEDDVVVLSPEVLSRYIDGCERSGLQHLGFSHHVKWNPRPTFVGPVLTTWPNLLAGWSVYSRECLEACGLFDEGFHNALEHVEHTMRLAQAGFALRPTPGAIMADVTGSGDLLAEQPGSGEDSTIGFDLDLFNAAKGHWLATRPDTFRMVW